MPSRIVLPAFHPEEWDEIKRLCADALPDTYAEYRARQQRVIKRVGYPPKSVEEVLITAAELLEFKIASGRDVDAKARNELAIQISIDRRRTRH